jgi:hypothetical protein
LACKIHQKSSRSIKRTTRIFCGVFPRVFEWTGVQLAIGGYGIARKNAKNELTGPKPIPKGKTGLGSWVWIS